MKLPKILRKLCFPVVAILVLTLIATLELREPFVDAPQKTAQESSRNTRMPSSVPKTPQAGRRGTA